MSTRRKPLVIPLSLAAGFFALSGNVGAVQFSYLDPAYEQEIYGVPTGSWSMPEAFTTNGNLVGRNGGNVLYEYSLTADAIYHGTSVHSYTQHAVSGLSSGYGMTSGIDGFIYANSAIGIQKIDTTTWTIAQNYATPGGYYGIDTLADGRIVHNAGSGIYVLDPVTGIDTLLYNAPTFIDDLAVAPTGEIFLAGLSAHQIIVLGSDGHLINTASTGAHAPDGLAFGGGAVFGNNTDGTVTRYDFAGPGFTGAATETLIASGGTYGDLASVGPDGSFYLSQNAIHWDDGSFGQPGIVRLSLIGGGGFEPGTGVTTDVPEPGTLLLLASGILGLGFSQRKRYLPRG